MREIKFSCMLGSDVLDVDEFAYHEVAQIQVQRFDWADAWDQLLRIANIGQGPDISEVGSTWLSSLIEMDALRPITSWRLNVQRDQDNFFPAARWAVTRPGDPRVWAVPLSTDTRVIYYRRDRLEQAGLEEEGAFATFDALSDTLGRLQASGVEIPWVMPTHEREVVYTSASWVWGHGGRFRTKDGRHMRLHEPDALDGLKAYFAMHRFLAPPARRQNIAGSDALFLNGQAAVASSGPWLFHNILQNKSLSPLVGIAPIPGIPFVGGTHLVLWRHMREDRIMDKFIIHLTSRKVQRGFFENTGNLPARIEVLNAAPFDSDPRYQAFATSLRTGRVFTVSYRWAAVEQRLFQLLNRIWDELAEDPQLGLESVVDERVLDFCEALEQTLLATM